ncbi:hypothetical protein ACH79_43515 [Bradyrhizobium sp. CCBAU 051011]|nr:hypothetical protein ACH79_43515 [Bradyrhizobium sp. CCBAU 051011]
MERSDFMMRPAISSALRICLPIAPVGGEGWVSGSADFGYGWRRVERVWRRLFGTSFVRNALRYGCDFLGKLYQAPINLIVDGHNEIPDRVRKSRG